MNYRFLADYMDIDYPLDVIYLTQGFGAENTDKNLLGTYQRYGLLGHNGHDYRATPKTKCYSIFKGKVIGTGFDKYSGNYVKIRSEEVKIGSIWYGLEAIYCHLDSVEVSKGDNVPLKGLIALTGNTGEFTTGPHLHLGIKIEWNKGKGWNKDYGNGYRGAIDPSWFLDQKERLPVDYFYNRERNWLAEFNMRFMNNWLHRQILKKLNRHPASITNRETNALVYGAWSFDEVFMRPEMFPIWSMQNKYDYLNKKI